MLANLGIFTESDTRRFALAPLGEAQGRRYGFGARVGVDDRECLVGARIWRTPVFGRDRQKRL
jgi:hypothetical protein